MFRGIWSIYRTHGGVVSVAPLAFLCPIQILVKLDGADEKHCNTGDDGGDDAARSGCVAGSRPSGAPLGGTPAEERARDRGVPKTVSSTIQRGNPAPEPLLS